MAGISAAAQENGGGDSALPSDGTAHPFIPSPPQPASAGWGLSTVVCAQHWHSWNTFTGENIVNYTNMKEMADALISTGMAEAGVPLPLPDF